MSAYLICTTPRSGSTVLSQVLEDTGIAGCPEEYFQQTLEHGVPRGPLDYLGRDLLDEVLPGAVERDMGLTTYDPRRFAGFAAYLDWVRSEATTPNGVFGIKVMSAYMAGLTENLREALGRDASASAADLLAAAFPAPRYVFLTRADKVRQAISLWRAIQTWTWRHEEPAPVAPDVTLTYDFRALDHLRRALEAEEAWWEDFFAESGIAPLRIVYEDFARDHESTVVAILEHAGVPVPEGFGVPQPTLKKQSDHRSEEWAERYHADAAALLAGDAS